MFRRRQPALIASLATVAASGVVAPAVAAGGPGQVLAATQAAAAGVVAPGVAGGAVVAEAATMLATVAGEATAESADEPEEQAEGVDEPAAEPAPDPVDEPPATTTPGEESPGDPATEPPAADEATTTTTTPVAAETEPTTTATTTTTTTTTPADEPADEPATDSTTTTSTPASADEPACEAPAEPAAETPADPMTTATSTPATADEPVCESTTTTTTTTTAPDEANASTTTDAPDQEPAPAPSTDPTVPTTVPAPVDTPVDGDDVHDGAPSSSDDEPSDDAAADEAAQPDDADGGDPPETVDPTDLPSPPTPIDTTPAEINTYDPGLRASSYDGVYAEGVPVGVAMATTRWLESGNRYDARARGSTASGAYQILDSTWQGYGGYARAVLAPPEVQDQFAYEAFTALLKRHGNDVSTIPVSWYIGHVPRGAEWDTVPKPEAGNKLTPRQYQAKWMHTFFSLLTEGAPIYLPSDTEALIPAIAFPVLGPVEFVDDWHFERDGGARRHEGLDFIGYEGQPIRAAFDGVVTLIKDVPSGIAGNGLRLTRDDGLYANYFHLSNSETGPVHSALEVGTRVRAGQIIGFMGSTGNAGIPHLHFELRTAEREPMAPYPAVMEAVQREQCTVGLGPWSTEFTSPAEKAEAAAAAFEAFADLDDEEVEHLLEEAGAEAAALAAFGSLGDEQVERVLERAGAEAAGLAAFAELDDQQVVRLLDLAESAADAAAKAEAETEGEHEASEEGYLTIEGPDGAEWVVGPDGSVTASGQAAMIGTYQTDCPRPIDPTDEADEPIMYGTAADGLAIDELPAGWWDDEAVDWTPDLDDDEAYVDPWELDQAELDAANHNHVDHVDHDDDHLASPQARGLM